MNLMLAMLVVVLSGWWLHQYRQARQFQAQMRQQLFRRITPTVLSRRQRRLLSRTVIQQWKPAVQMETNHV